MWNPCRLDRLPRAAVILLGLFVAGCVAPTPYMAADPATGAGYSEQAIEGNRYEVRFIGNSATPPEVVRRYMLFRAAELTLQTGNDWFRIVRRGRDNLSALTVPELEGAPVRLSRRGHGARGGQRAARAQARHYHRSNRRAYRRGYRYGRRYGPRRYGYGFSYGFVVGAPLFYYVPAWAYEPRPYAYDATAEIQVFPGEKPADDADAYDASEVVERLGPTIVRPEPPPT